MEIDKEGYNLENRPILPFKLAIKKWEEMENVNVYDISTLNANDINQIINVNDVIVCGWCFSERSKLIIKALGKGE